METSSGSTSFIATVLLRRLMVMNEITDDNLERLWGEGAIRVFISHTSEHKKEAANLKMWLSGYGIASFVAHEDIAPMMEWQNELIRALESMGILVAMLTEGFSRSYWTDQEVGFAVATKVPIVPIRMGRDPYGFMGKYQAISISGDFNSSIAEKVFNYALRDDKLKAQATDAFIVALRSSSDFYRANHLARRLKEITELTSLQEQALVDAFNQNRQVSGAWVVKENIALELKRLNRNDYEIDGDRLKMSLP